MAATRVEPAQTGESVEALKQGFGQRGKLGAAADRIQVAQDLAVDTAHDLAVGPADKATGFNELKVPEELLAVEVRQHPPSVSVQSASV